MSRRTRLFMGIAVGVLVLGLGTGLVASYMGGLQNLAIIGGDPDELGYLPNDARIVAYANVRDVMDSELRQKLQELHPGSDDGRARIEQATGVDISRDVDQVFAAVSDTSDDRNDRPLLLIRGRFDEVRIEGVVREQGGSVEDYKGERLLVHQGANLAVAFVEPGLVVLGSPMSVRRAIDTKAGALDDITDNADVMRLLHDVDDGNAWAVARFDTLTSSGLPSGVASRLPPIGWLAASGYVNGGIRGAIRAEARDDMAAQDLRDVVRGFIALARMQAGQRQEFADLMDSLTLGGNGNTVSLGFTIPSETLDALGALHAGGNRPPR